MTPPDRVEVESPKDAEHEPDVFQSMGDALERFEDIAEFQVHNIPKAVQNLKKTSGKVVNKLIPKKQRTDLKKIVGKDCMRKAFAQELREQHANFKALERASSVLSKIGTGLSVGHQALKWHENTVGVGLTAPTDHVVEASFRAGEFAFEKASGALLLKGALIIAGSKVTIPFVLTYWAVSGGIKEYAITPAWEYIEDSWKPWLQDCLKATPMELPEYRNPRSICLDTVGVSSESGKETVLDSKYRILVQKLFDEKVEGATRGTSHFQLQLPNGQSVKVSQVSSIPEKIVVPYLSSAMDERALPGVRAGLEKKWASTSTANIFTEVSGSSLKDLQTSFGGEITTQSASKETNVGGGAKIILGAGGVALGVAGTLASSETTLTGAATLAANGSFSGSLALATTNPVGMALGTAAVVGMGANLVGKEIRQATATRRTPFLKQDSHDCLEFDRMLRRFRYGSLTEAQRGQLIAQIARCDNVSSADENGRFALRCMRYELEHTKRDPVSSWYNQHDISSAVTFYEASFKEKKQEIERLMEDGNLIEARKACNNFQQEFSCELLPKKFHKILHDKELLVQQADAFLSHGMIERADRFHQAAFKDISGNEQYHLRFAEHKLKLGICQPAQQLAEEVLEHLERKSSSSIQVREQKEQALCLCVKAEICKPVDQCSLDYIGKQLDKVTSDARSSMSDQVDASFEARKVEIFNEIISPEKSQPGAKEDAGLEKAQAENLSDLSRLTEMQFHFLKKETEVQPEHSEHFLKGMRLSVELNKFDEAVEMADKKLAQLIIVYGEQSDRVVGGEDLAGVDSIANVFSNFSKDSPGERNEKSIKILNRITTLPLSAGDMAKACFMLGDAHFSQTQFSLESAIFSYEKGLKYDDSNLVVQYNLSNKYYQLALLKYEEGDVVGAQTHTAAAIKQLQEVLGDIKSTGTSVALSEEKSSQLMEYAEDLNNKAHSLSVYSELEKPVDQQSSDYLLKHLTQLPTDAGTMLSEQVDSVYEFQKYQLSQEMKVIKEDSKLNEKEKQSQLDAKQNIFQALLEHQYDVAKSAYEKDSGHTSFFVRTIQNAAELGDFSQIEIMTLKELGVLDRGEVIAAEKIDRLTALTEGLYHLGLRSEGEGKLDFAIDTLNTILSGSGLPDKLKATCHLYLGGLHSKGNEFDRAEVLQHYQQSHQLDPTKKFAAASLADEYCRRLQYGKAREVIATCAAQQASKDDAILGLAGDQLELRATRMNLLGLAIASKGFRMLTGWLAKKTVLSDDIRKCAATTQLLESVVTPSVSFYLRWCQRTLIENIQQRDPNYKKPTYPNRVAQAQTVLSAVSVGLQAFSVLNQLYYDEKNHQWHKEVGEALELAQFGVDVASTGLMSYGAALSLVDSGLWNIPLSKLDPSQLFNLSVHGFSIISPAGSFIKRWYFDDWRKKGESPTSILGLFLEDVAYLTGNNLTVAVSAIYMHAEAIQEGVTALGIACPGLAESISNGGAYLAAKATAAAAAAKGTVVGLWTAGGLLTKGAMVVSGTAAAGVLFYGGYRCYHYRLYNQNIHNASKKIAAAKAEPDKAYEHLQNAQKELDIIYSNWTKPEDRAGALFLQDQLNALALLYDPNIKSLSDVVKLCDQRIKVDSMDETFRKIRVTALIKMATEFTLSAETDDLPEAERNRQTAQRKARIDVARKDTAELLKLNSKKFEVHWMAAVIEELDGHFSSAQSALQRLHYHITDLSVEAKQAIKQKEAAIQKNMNRLASQVGSFFGKGLSQFRDRFFCQCEGELKAYKGDTFLEGQIYWKEDGAYIREGNVWASPPSDLAANLSPSEGHLVQRNGQIYQVGKLPGLFIALDRDLNGLRELSAVINQHFSPKAAAYWAENVIAVETNSRRPLYAPQMAGKMEAVHQAAEQAKELARPYHKKFETCQTILDAVMSLKQSIPGVLDRYQENVEKEVDSLYEQIDLQGREKLKTSVSKDLEKLKVEGKQAITTLKEGTEELKLTTADQEKYEAALDEKVAEIEAELALHVERSVNMLWVKTLTEVAAQITTIIQDTIGDIWQHARAMRLAAEDKPLPVWQTGDDLLVDASFAEQPAFHDQPLLPSTATFWQKPQKTGMSLFSSDANQPSASLFAHASSQEQPTFSLSSEFNVVF